MNQLLTKEELAGVLQCSPRTVDNLRRHGLPTVMVASSPRFELEPVVKWLKNHPVKQAQAVLDSATQVRDKLRRKEEGKP